MCIQLFQKAHENKKKKLQVGRKSTLSYYTSFAKITALLGLTVGATVYMKNELEIQTTNRCWTML